MKKYLGVMILLLGMMFVFSPCFAEVTKIVDEFNGDVMHASKNVVFPFKLTDLYNHEGGHCFIMLFRIEDKWHFFETIDIKVDEQIYSLETAHSSKEIISETANTITSGSYILTNEIKRAIKEGQEVTLRVHYHGIATSTTKIPFSILLEWKEVLSK